LPWEPSGESTVTANQTVIKGVTITTNNNNEEGDMFGKEHSVEEEKEQLERESEKEKLEKEQKEEPLEGEHADKSKEEELKEGNDEKEQSEHQQSDEEPACSSNLECQLSPLAASAVLAANKPNLTSGTIAIDSDDDPPPAEDETPARGFPRFHSRSIPTNRSYRRINIELLGTVTDSESSDSGEPELQEDTEDAEVEADSDEPAAAAEEDQHEDESSSDSSVDEMVRYSLSSESESTIEVSDFFGRFLGYRPRPLT